DLFRHNIGCGPRRIPIRHIRARSEVAMAALETGSFDLIHLDGSHYYDAVSADIRHAIRLVREGGIIAGDDLNVQLPDIAEEKVRQHLQEDCVIEEDGFFYHPGVTLAVAENFGRATRVETCWAVQKQGGAFQPADFRKGTVVLPGHFTPEMKTEAR